MATQSSETVLAAASLPIVEVVVLEDRARVKRRGTLPVGETTTHFALPDVATVIVDRTLSGATLTRTGGTTSRVPIGSIRVDRERLHEVKALPARLAELEASMEAARHRIAGHESTLRELEAYVVSLGAIGKMAVDDTVLDAAHDLGDVALYRARFAALDDKLAHARAERLSLEASLGNEQAELSGLERTHAVERASSTRDRATLRFALAPAADASGAVEVELEYVVANACWRPLHRAELTEDERSSHGALIVRTDGCVWQRTGEDWPDVALVLSTERSARDAAPPLLATDRLGVKKKSAVTSVAVRSEEIVTTGQGVGPGGAPGSDLPGVDDGGSAQRLAASGVTTVRGDGRPHRVSIGHFETEAELSLRAVPEVIPAVLRRSRQKNAAPRPLLAGPVELVRNGGFVGTTSVRFMAAGESFDLGWGPEGALRLHREEVTRPGDPGLLSSQRVTLVDRVLRLSNLGPSPLVLEILERIPVSELEKVKVSLDPKRSHKGATADEDGMVRIPLTLAPAAQATVSLGFELRAASDVVGLPY